MKKYGYLFFIIVISFSSGHFSPSQAQSDEALLRVDQAMEHLGFYLSRPISRATHQWSWTEKIFPDTSLDCPFDDIIYSQQTTRGYQFRITVETTDYDYRVTADGMSIVLCINGRPDLSSVGIAFPDNPITVSDTPEFDFSQPLNQSPWWAWAYVVETDSLYLINPQGQQAKIFRPRLPNEKTGATPQLTFSRDGRFLIIANELNSGAKGLGFYALETGTFTKVHELPANEDIYLGFGYDNSAITGSPYSVDPSSQLIAVGLSSTDFLTPSWRVIIFELVTGDAIYQMQHDSPQLALLGTTNEIVFPRVVYYGDDVVHVQLIRFGAGGAEAYPTFAWHPNANFVETSPFFTTQIDIAPQTNEAAFTYFNDGNITPSDTSLIPLNAVGAGQPVAPRALYVDNDFSFSEPRWAGGGQYVLFRGTDSAGNQAWGSVNPDGSNILQLDQTNEAVYGTPDGFLSRTTTGEVLSFISPTNANQIWRHPNDTQTVIAWVSPTANSFGLSSIYIPPSLVGVVHCPNTPVSNVTIGMNARVSAPALRLRELPAGEFIQSMQTGIEFVITSGPVCQGSYTWWEIRLPAGTIGWAAEADSDLYYIEPIPES